MLKINLATECSQYHPVRPTTFYSLLHVPKRHPKTPFSKTRHHSLTYRKANGHRHALSRTVARDINRASVRFDNRSGYGQP